MSNASKHLRRIIAENGPDRVRAVLALARLASEESPSYAPPADDTDALMHAALTRILRATPFDMAIKALCEAFPDRATLFLDVQATSKVAGPTISGGDLE